MMEPDEASAATAVRAGRVADVPIGTIDLAQALRQEPIGMMVGFQAYEGKTRDVALLIDYEDYRAVDRLSKKAGIYRESPPDPKVLPEGFILRENGEPVAGLTYYYSEAGGKKSMDLGNLAVDPEMQRGGMGKALLKEFFKKMDELGVGQFTMMANDAAASVYFQGYMGRKLGFAMVKLDPDDLICREFIVKKPAGKGWYESAASAERG